MRKKIWLPLFISIFLILFTLLTNLPYQPKGLVENRTFEKYYDLFFTYEITRYPTSAQVLPAQPNHEKLTLGVVVDPWNLNFGIVPAGKNFVTRFVDLTNLKEKDAKIMVRVYGNISPFVNFTKNNFILKPNENAMIEVKFYAEKAEIGNYSGEIDVVVQRPRYDFLYYFWK
ncbi:MAG: hypothetical protein QW040_00065 [Candidatus Aenigmatarchaeota archaeon]